MFLANSDLKLDVRTRCLSSSFLKNSTLYLRVLPNNLSPQGMLFSICKQEGWQFTSNMCRDCCRETGGLGSTFTGCLVSNLRENGFSLQFLGLRYPGLHCWSTRHSPRPDWLRNCHVVILGTGSLLFSIDMIGCMKCHSALLRLLFYQWSHQHNPFVSQWQQLVSARSTTI